jgi:hypothetical protein
MILGVAAIVIAAASDTDSQDICRCLTTLYSSRPGEQALDRDFGISTEAVDKPLDTAKALLTAEIVRKTARYEPRVRVLRVEWDDTQVGQGVLIPKVVIECV